MPAIFLIIVSALLTAAIVLRSVRALRHEIDHSSARLASLDGLRGLLCVGVVIHHAAITEAMVRTGVAWPRAESGVLELFGHAAVAFFFCITGFLFWGRVVEHGFRFGWLAFYRGRVMRIVPLYVLMAALAATLLLTDRSADAISASRLAGFFGEVFSFGFQNWSPIDVGTRAIRTESFDAGVHWTLRYEWMFYFALPLLAPLARGWRPLLIVAIAVWGVVATGSSRALPISLMFGVGMLAAYAVRSPRGVDAMKSGAASVVVMVAVGLLLICSRPWPWMLGVAPTANGMSPLALVLTAVIFLPLAAGNTLFGLLDVAPLRWLGTISYSVYLLHGVLLYVARPWIVPLVQPSPSANLGYWLAIAGVTVALVVLSSITYRLIEQPFIAWDKRLRSASRA